MMDINSVNNSSVYGTQAKVDERRPLAKPDDSVQVSSNIPVDKLEISEEAKLSSLLDYSSIRERIKSGFYDNTEVLQEVAIRLSKDLPAENIE